MTRHRPRLTRAACTVIVALIWTGVVTPAVAQPARAEPAVVPEAVRIPRPSPEEVRAAERGLAEFLRTADRETRDVLDRYPGLLEVRPPRPNTAIVPNLSGRFRAKHAEPPVQPPGRGGAQSSSLRPTADIYCGRFTTACSVRGHSPNGRR